MFYYFWTTTQFLNVYFQFAIFSQSNFTSRVVLACVIYGFAAFQGWHFIQWMGFCKQYHMCLPSSFSQHTLGRTSPSYSWRPCGQQTSTTAFMARYGQSWVLATIPFTTQLTATTMATTPSGWTGCLARCANQQISSRTSELCLLPCAVLCGVSILLGTLCRLKHRFVYFSMLGPYMLCFSRNLVLFLVMQWNPGTNKSLVDAFWIPDACTIRHFQVNIECTILSCTC